jgi:3-hydroxyisobutyrate dehydrogenase-like beta-hydroxyacid dehydrogenase
MSTGATPSYSDDPDASTRLRAGVVGLGAIGRGVAISLARSGHLVHVFDLRPEALAGLDGIASQERSAAEVARKSNVILVAALDEPQVHNALTKPDGILAGAHADTIVVVLSTISVEAVHKFADVCAGGGVGLLDCGVAPGDQAPNNGLVAFVGGPDAVVARAMPVLNGFARAVLHCGPLGTGMTVKIARNVISYCTWTVIDEAVDLAHAAGVDRDTILKALRAADARDPQYLKMLEVRASGFEVSSERIDNALTTAAKDLDAATVLADTYAVRLPLTEATKPLVREVFIRNGGAR